MKTAAPIVMGLALLAAPAVAAPGKSPGDLASVLDRLPVEVAGDVDKTIGMFEFIARNFAALNPDDREFALSTAGFYENDDPAGSARIAGAAERWAKHFRARGNHTAELSFLGARTNALPPALRLGGMRAVHRRAVELGLVEGGAASSMRAGIAEWSRSLLDEGRYDEAERALGDTVAELGGIDKVQDDRLLRIYAEALASQGKGDLSDAAFARVVAYWKAYKPPASGFADNPTRKLQLAYNQMAYYLNLQRRFADAAEPGRLAAEMAVPLFGREDMATQKARYNYAVALLGQGKPAEALPYFEEALTLQRGIEVSFGNLDPNRDTAILLTTLGRARSQVPGREADGFAAAIEAADIVRKRQLPAAGVGKVPNAGPAALAAALAQGHRRDPLSPAFDMVLFAGWAARDKEAGALDAAFRAAQELTVSEAGDAITQAAARELAGGGLLGTLVRDKQDTTAAIIANERAYRTALLGSNAESARALGSEQGRLAERIATINARLAREFPDYADLVRPRAVGPAEVQAALGADEGFVMMMPSESHFYAFAITREAIRWNRIDGGAAQVEALVGRLRCRLDEATCSPAEAEAVARDDEGAEPTPIDDYYPRYDRGAAWRLYGLTLAPFARMLRSKKTIYTVSAGPVAGMPLAALVTADPGEKSAAQNADDLIGTPWLGDVHAFVTLPSASAITLPRTRKVTGGGGAGLVGYGAPVLGPAPATGRGARGGRAPLRAAAFFAAPAGGVLKVDPAQLRKLASLPGTRRELEQLASSLGSVAEANLRLGPAATETAVKRDAMLPEASVVVFATHGLLPGEMGLAAEPGLVLTPPSGAGTPADDGLLTASETAALDLHARWVILSACNTATADGGGSDALSGLARAFLYAGADSLLASHWRVADDASAALTVQTIRANTAGFSQAAALQAATRAVRTGRDTRGQVIAEWRPHWAHPAAWAPFTLITDHDR